MCVSLSLSLPPFLSVILLISDSRTWPTVGPAGPSQYCVNESLWRWTRIWCVCGEHSGCFNTVCSCTFMIWGEKWFDVEGFIYCPLNIKVATRSGNFWDCFSFIDFARRNNSFLSSMHEWLRKLHQLWADSLSFSTGKNSWLKTFEHKLEFKMLLKSTEVLNNDI